MTMDYDDAVSRAATSYHRSWCTIPFCVHTPFPDDLARANTMLGPLRAQLEEEAAELGRCQELLDETRSALAAIGARL